MISAANLTLLYGQLPLEQRFSAARADGFRNVEILFPYDQSPQWYADRLHENELNLVLVNTPTEAGTAQWGRAAIPGQERAFRQDFSRVAELCEVTACKAVHVMVGCLPPEAHSAGREVLLSNLEWAAGQVPDLVLQLEALNSEDVPGYFYSKPSIVRSILQEAKLASAGMQFDFYHVLREGLELEAELEASLPWIRHVQVAGTPERNEPDLERDTGFLAGFRRLHEAGYLGCVGFEYRPADSISEGLRWAAALKPYFSQLPTAAFR